MNPTRQNIRSLNRPFLPLILMGMIVASPFFTLQLSADTPTVNDSSLVEAARVLEKRETLGIRFAGSKRGWVIDETRIENREDGPVLIREKNLYIDIAEQAIIQAWRQQVYSLQGKGQLKSYDEQFLVDGMAMHVTGQCKGDVMNVSVCSPDECIELQVNVERFNVKAQIEFDQWLRGERKSGDQFEKFRLPSFPDDKVEVEAWELVAEKNEDSQLEREYSINTGGRTSSCSFDENLDLIRCQTGPSEFFPTTESELLLIEDPVGTLLKVSLVAPIKDQDSISQITFNITGTKARVIKYWLSGPQRHRIETRQEEELVQLTISSDKLANAEPVELTESELERLTSTGDKVDWDEGKIKSLVESVVGEENDPLEKARLINRWIFQNMTYVRMASEPDASTVAKQLIGDCSEYARLFVAMNRAADIPAEEVYGLAFCADAPDELIGHAWARIHVNGQWLTFDPCWNQVDVDVTHIAVPGFSERFLKVAGKFQFEVANVKMKQVETEIASVVTGTK